jgi:hypothetical protein
VAMRRKFSSKCLAFHVPSHSDDTSTKLTCVLGLAVLKLEIVSEVVRGDRNTMWTVEEVVC